MAVIEEVRQASAELANVIVQDGYAEISFRVLDPITRTIRTLTVTALDDHVKVHLDNLLAVEIDSPELADLVRDVARKLAAYQLKRVAVQIAEAFREMEELRKSIEEMFNKIEQSIEEEMRQTIRTIRKILEYNFRIYPVPETPFVIVEESSREYTPLT